MAVDDAAIARALCCGSGGCVRPERCSVADGRVPRNLLVWLDDAIPAVRELFAREAASAE